MVKSDWLGFGKHRKKIGLIRAKSSLILINKLIFRLIEEKISFTQIKVSLWFK